MRVIPHTSRFWVGLLLTLTLSGCTGDDQPAITAKRIAPDFTLTLFNGQEFKLSQHQGHPVIINFFASWCIPCGEEAPVLEAAYQELKPQGVVFVGVAGQDTPSKAEGFVKKWGMTFPTGLDATGKILEAYGVYGMPTTFFIDRAGVINDLHIGGVTKELIHYELAKMH
ncbi:MAG: TlpA family protein disulfide reductase [Magnetococcus sp. YQC-5]